MEPTMEAVAETDSGSKALGAVVQIDDGKIRTRWSGQRWKRHVSPRFITMPPCGWFGRSTRRVPGARRLRNCPI
jgi:hypothetical protein